jgi:DNA-directed RNA polymerase specialized sigma24 family protein
MISRRGIFGLAAVTVATPLSQQFAVTPAPSPELAIDPAAVTAEARILLDLLAARLPAIEGEILLAHVRDGVPLAESAARLALPPQEIHRRWYATKRWLRGEIAMPPTPVVVG